LVSLTTSTTRNKSHKLSRIHAAQEICKQHVNKENYEWTMIAIPCASKQNKRPKDELVVGNDLHIIKMNFYFYGSAIL